MNKHLSLGGTGLLRFCTALAVVGLMVLLTPSSHAQTPTYSLTFNGFPDGRAGVNPTDYIGLDRKLKPNVAGQTLTILVTPPLATPKQVRLSIQVNGAGLASTLPNCNKTIATAVTVPFPVSGGGRTLASSDFTGSGIGIQESYTNQSCVDDISDKITKGAVALPNGIYSISATLNDATTGAVLASQTQNITITAGSITEAIINLTSPANGQQVQQSATVTFDFNTSIPGKLLVFEHSSLSQSPDDATRDDNSPLKVVDVDITQAGSPQVIATNPGIALRPWTAGKKYSWYFRGSVPNSSGSADIKKSPVWSFVVVSSDPNYTRLINALQSLADPIGSTYNNLIGSGYLLNMNGTFSLQEGDNGTPQQKTIDQVLSILNGLASKNVQFKVGVTQ